MMAGHVAPEAACGGPIAAVRDGDEITIDADARRIDLKLSQSEVAKRMKGWRAPAPRYTLGVFAKYAALVSSAAEGAVTRPPGDGAAAAGDVPRDRASAARLPADGQAADRDAADGQAAESNHAKGHAAKGDYPGGDAAEAEHAQRSAAERDQPARFGTDGQQDAARVVANRDPTASRAASAGRWSGAAPARRKHWVEAVDVD
jgi:hypothetical protein